MSNPYKIPVFHHADTDSDFLARMSISVSWSASLSHCKSYPSYAAQQPASPEVAPTNLTDLLNSA